MNDLQIFGKIPLLRWLRCTIFFIARIIYLPEAGQCGYKRTTFHTMALSTLLSLAANLSIMLGLLGDFTVQASDEKRLRDELLLAGNWKVRPVENFTDRLELYLNFVLTRVAELDLKDQVLTLNARIEQEWTDYKFKWDPNEYGGVTQIDVSSDSIWLPDFQLYNAFGEFELKGRYALIHYTGKITWRPSAILKTFCPIEVRYYPFDIQTCQLIFGSWTYDGDKLFITLKDLGHKNMSTLAVGMTLKDYYPSAEWDLISIPATFKDTLYECCAEHYTSIQIDLTLRRHPHFYLVNLVMPLIGLSYLSLLVFYLPADSGEKITLSVSVVTSQVMFLLLMMHNIPVTSLAVPLLGKIIVFNMIIVFLSIMCTTIVLNIHYRKPTTHKQPKWVMRVRYSFIPKILWMEAIPLESMPSRRRGQGHSYNGGHLNSQSNLEEVSRLCSQSLQEIDHRLQGTSQEGTNDIRKALRSQLRSVLYVRDYMQRLEEINSECEEWKFLAAVFDRIFLVLFNIAFVLGTGIMMMDAPALFDNRTAVDKTLSIINSQQQDEFQPDYDNDTYQTEEADEGTISKVVFDD